MRQADGGREVRQGARPLHAVGEDEGRAGGAGEHGRLAEPDVQVQLGAPARHHVARRRGRPRPLHECFADAGALAVHPGAVRLEKRERFRVEHGAADLVEQPEGRLVDLAAAAVVEHALHWFGHVGSSWCGKSSSVRPSGVAERPAGGAAALRPPPRPRSR